MGKLTAVEWFVNEVLNPEYGEFPKYIVDVINQAKEMEKTQIIDAFDRGLITENVYYRYDDKKVERYYNENFNTE
jgi:hypothetical protein